MNTVIDLSNMSWQVIPCPPFALTPDASNAIDAVVPGGILLDLQRAGMIEDPFYGENFRRCAWCDQWTYWYECRFTTEQLHLDPLEPGQTLELLLEGVDTFGEVWLNDTCLGEVHNMFRRYRFDLTQHLNDVNDNTLRIRIDPVIASTTAWCQAHQIDCSSKWMSFNITERIAARKMQMSYGWDNTPHLLTGGLFRPVKLLKHNACELDDLRWHVEHLDTQAKQATLCVQGQVISRQSERLDDLTVRLEGTCRDHRFAGDAIVQKDGSWKATLLIEDPYFWWPATLGDPDQYQTRVTLHGRTGQILDQDALRIGLRTLQVVTQPARRQLVSQVTGTSNPTLEMDGGFTSVWTHVPLDPPEMVDVHPFHLMVNGVLVFIRGANWQTPDAIPGRVNPQQLKTLIDAALWANINLIRLWGGGTVEPDVFYQTCSDLGMLVWQDFHFACAQYPDEQPFLDEIQAESEDIVKRLRNHTCLACWCGNNEGDMIDYDRHIDYTRNPISRGILPDTLAQHDPQHRYYHPSSPTSYPSTDPDPRQNHAGDRRNWGGWYPENNYEHIRLDLSRVVSEGGMYAWPSAATLDDFMPRDLQWPADHPTCHLHAGDLDFFQRDFLNTTLRACHFFQDPKDRSELIAISQFAQGWSFKMLIERCRQRKPECGGVIIWKLNDAWPAVDAGLLDYRLIPRTALQMVRDAYAPVAVSISQDSHQPSTQASTWLVNDLNHPLTGTLELDVAVWEDAQAASPRVVRSQALQMEVPANAAVCALTIAIESLDPATTVLIARFRSEDAKHHSQTFYTLSPAVAWRYWQTLKSTPPQIAQAPDLT